LSSTAASTWFARLSFVRSIEPSSALQLAHPRERTRATRVAHVVEIGVVHVIAELCRADRRVHPVLRDEALRERLELVVGTGRARGRGDARKREQARGRSGGEPRTSSNQVHVSSRQTGRGGA
jgi:hypothetical protein